MFSQKSVYQSELASVTENGPITIVLTGPPRNSKNKSLAGYSTFTGPDGQDHYLNIENPHIRQTLEGLPLNVPLQVRFLGSGDQATMQVEGQGGAQPAPATQQPATTTPAAPAPAPSQAIPGYPGDAPAGNGGGQPAANGNGTPHARVYWECLQAAHDIVEQLLMENPQQFEGLTGDGRLATEHAIAAVLFIEFKKVGGRVPIRHTPQTAQR